MYNFRCSLVKCCFINCIVFFTSSMSISCLYLIFLMASIDKCFFVFDRFPCFLRGHIYRRCSQLHSLIYSNITLLSYSLVCYSSLSLLNISSCPFPERVIYSNLVLQFPYQLSASLHYRSCPFPICIVRLYITNIDHLWPCFNVFSNRSVTCSILAPGIFSLA